MLGRIYMDDFIKRKIATIKGYVYWAKYLLHPMKRCAYILGTPTHNNIGDSAIVIAEKKYLLKNGYEMVVEITAREYESNRKGIVRLVPRTADIFIPGGGNMGSLWPIEEQWRQHIIEDFSQHSIVVFPQTIYYSSDVDAEALKIASISVYDTKTKLTVVAREKKSYELLKQLYPHLNVLLTPDIVLSLGQQNFDVQRVGVLICFRKDKERKLNVDDEKSFIQTLKEQGYGVTRSDTMSDRQITVENREDIFNSKLREFAGARLVITDRLHGMVFAAITGTPCIALGNNHYKVSGTYEWLKELDYIEYVSTLDEVKKHFDRLYNKENNIFSMDSARFAPLSDVICNIHNRGK